MPAFFCLSFGQLFQNPFSLRLIDCTIAKMSGLQSYSPTVQRTSLTPTIAAHFNA